MHLYILIVLVCTFYNLLFVHIHLMVSHVTESVIGSLLVEIEIEDWKNRRSSIFQFAISVCSVFIGRASILVVESQS